MQPTERIYVTEKTILLHSKPTNNAKFKNWTSSNGKKPVEPLNLKTYQITEY